MRRGTAALLAFLFLMTGGCNAVQVPVSLDSTPTASTSPDLPATATARARQTALPIQSPYLIVATPESTQPITATRALASGDFVTAIVLAADTKGANFDPIGPTLVFTPTEKFHAVVTIENAPKAKLTADWFAADVGRVAPPNTKIGTTDLISEGSRNLDFALTSETGHWPDGKYRVEILAEGKLIQGIDFYVESTAATSGFSFLDQAVLAKSVRPGTFEPTQTTSTFSPTDSPFHLVVHLAGAPTGTSLGVTWLFNDQQIGNFALVSDGTRYVDFTYRQANGYWTPGSYHASVFVNGVAFRTLDFSVQ